MRLYPEEKWYLKGIFGYELIKLRLSVVWFLCCSMSARSVGTQLHPHM